MQVKYDLDPEPALDQVQNIQEEREKESLVLRKQGVFKELKKEIKQNFTIVQKTDTLHDTSRKIVCKTNGCKVKGKLVCVGKSEECCEYWLNKFDHLPTCQSSIDPFESLTFQEIMKTGAKPTRLIEKFNEETERKGRGFKD